ncbi:transposase family protein [Yinghuangia sp. YIM S09857]|uniref:transposase family protein n=1 Tax=Yinghuangia sp. YIM S09857 TaxID=3436929 RepID=UPI003F52B968
MTVTSDHPAEQAAVSVERAVRGDEPRFWDLVWPDVEGLAVYAVEIVDDAVRIDVHSRQPRIACRACGAEASRVHSSYERRVADRPLGGRRVVLRLRVRRGPHQSLQALPPAPLPVRSHQRHGSVPRDARTRLPRQPRHGHQIRCDPARRHRDHRAQTGDPAHLRPRAAAVTAWAAPETLVPVTVGSAKLRR